METKLLKKLRKMAIKAVKISYQNGIYTVYEIKKHLEYNTKHEIGLSSFITCRKEAIETAEYYRREYIKNIVINAKLRKKGYL